jgi:hypothetical protein
MVETSTFGSEFVAMKTAVELVEALRYKLRMFGVPVAGPTSVFCDNNAVVLNSSIPESTLSKKDNATTELGKPWLLRLFRLRRRTRRPT